MEELLNSLGGLMQPKFQPGDRVTLNKKYGCGKYNMEHVRLMPDSTVGVVIELPNGGFPSDATQVAIDGCCGGHRIQTTYEGRLKMKFTVTLTVDATDADNGKDLDTEVVLAHIAKYFQIKNDCGYVQFDGARLKFAVSEVYETDMKFAPGTRVCSTAQLLQTDKYLGAMLRGLPDGHVFTVLEPPEKREQDWPADATPVQVGRACWAVETRLLRKVD